MTVRRLEAADWPEWQRMRRALWSESTEDDMRAWSARPDAIVVVCVRDGGGLAGFAEAGTRPYADGCGTSPVAFLEGWWVDPDRRRTGIGRRLVDGVEAWAHARGLRELASDSLLADVGAQRAHERVGFVEVERAVRYRKVLDVAEPARPAGASDCTVRRATAADVPAVVALFAAVAAEGRWIGTEAGFDPEIRARRFADNLAKGDDFASFVALAPDGTIVGNLGIERREYGVAELGMLVADGWRRRGVGALLLAEAIAWARTAGAHKVALEVWPHNAPARALYRRFGFVEEGRRRRHYRRRSGELWDALLMGLVLDETTPGAPYAE